jgi:hypothetical protein
MQLSRFGASPHYSRIEHRFDVTRLTPSRRRRLGTFPDGAGACGWALNDCTQEVAEKASDYSTSLIRISRFLPERKTVSGNTSPTL